jgi:hypothetical protein
MKIYVASSWRNQYQPPVVDYLRGLGHDVYDFRNPPNKSGFGWEQVNPRHVPGAPVSAIEQYAMTNHPIARDGYASDLEALRACDALLYVLPCGRSASWEFGYAMGQGKPCFVLWIGDHEPELMFREARVIGSWDGLRKAFE